MNKAMEGPHWRKSFCGLIYLYIKESYENI
jgi:hypothetical protein